MMQRPRILRHTEEDVPCGWAFYSGPTSFSVTGHTFIELVDNVHEHLEANGITVSKEVVIAAVHEQLCEQLPEKFWRYVDE